jgi:transposase-like protein
MSVFKETFFHDEKAAYAFVEAHIWPDGRICPHCGVIDKSGPLGGTSTRIGVYKCYACRKPFTVKVGTIFEASHIKLHIWLQAIFLMTASKKGISSNQLHRTLGITLRSAWFMSHRIRAAMDPLFSSPAEPIGGAGKIVEADETYFGTKKGATKKAAFHHKMAVLSLVERGGEIRSFHVDHVTKESVKEIVTQNVRKESRLYTDGATWYQNNAMELEGGHDWVDHGREEYVRGDVYTNTLEGFFSIFKRGMKGIYQHCDEKHLHRYLAEFDFRYNERKALGVDDGKRAEKALAGFRGKRLTYRTTRQ